MRVTICGSMAHKLRMKELSEDLVKRGYEVELPDIEEGRVRTELDQDIKRKQGYIDQHFTKIGLSEAVLIVNEPKNGADNYIGGNTLLEMGHAYTQGLDIFLLNSVPEESSYVDEIRGMHPIALEGNLDALEEHINNLPLVFMSTTSGLKHEAVARGLRRAGISVRVDGAKVESGVNEQPLTAQETYEGAMNRQAALKKLGQTASYYVTVESGQHPIHENHSLFGCNVVIVERAGEAPKVGIHLDVEFPQEMLDLIPAVYPDLGTLVQEKYGATERDPLAYFTNGRLSRRKMIEDAVYNVAVQLEEKS